MSENTNRQRVFCENDERPIEIQVMDVSLDEEVGEDVPLTSRCYMSNTRETKLIPEQLAGYTCRWIHFATGKPSFDQFMSIVEDLMSDYGHEERRAVQNGLRKFRVQNEVRGSYGPTFRPAFATFRPDANPNDNDWRNGAESCQSPHDIPAFCSLPTVHFETTMDYSKSIPPFTIAKPCDSPISSSVSTSCSSISSSASSSSFSSIPSLPPPPPGILPVSSSLPSLPPAPLADSPYFAPRPSSYAPASPPRILSPPNTERRFSSARHGGIEASEVHHAGTETHGKKSLLRYNYRFGKDPRGREKLVLSNHLSEVSMEPTVHETWCLVVDKKNLVTVSRLNGGEIWPLGLHGDTSSHFFDKVPNCLRMAVWDYLNFQSQLGDLNRWTSFASLFPVFSTLFLFVFLFFTIIHDLISVVIPIFWIPAHVVRLFFELIIGPGFGLSYLLRITSVVFTVLRTTRYRRTRGRIHRVLNLLLTFIPYLGTYVGSPRLELTSPTLGQHIDYWIEVEEKMRSQEEPPEEVFKALRRLWRIIIHFSMNFFATPDGKIYRLDVCCAERRILRTIEKGLRLLAHGMGIARGKEHETQPNMLKISESPRRKGETLEDLETEFQAAVENLEWQLGAVMTDIESVNQSENREILRAIHNSTGCPAMSCMFRMCTITTPTRFAIASRDISDLYARWISQEEYLMRDSVTQSLVYLISNTEDELRILKGILNGQQKVIAQVAESYAKALLFWDENQLGGVRRMRDFASYCNNSRNETACLNYPTKTCNWHNKEPLTNTQDRNGDETFQALVNSLQSKARLRYDLLMSEIERHEENITRLKAQSALLISIKSERQEMAIFVFTLVTVIFLPLSFVTSYLGMNTSDIRDMEMGQSLFWIIASPVTVVVLFVSWFIARRGLTWKIYRQRRGLRNVEDWKWRYRD